MINENKKLAGIGEPNAWPRIIYTVWCMLVCLCRSRAEFFFLLTSAYLKTYIMMLSCHKTSMVDKNRGSCWATRSAQTTQKSVKYLLQPQTKDREESTSKSCQKQTLLDILRSSLKVLYLQIFKSVRILWKKSDSLILMPSQRSKYKNDNLYSFSLDITDCMVLYHSQYKIQHLHLCEVVSFYILIQLLFGLFDTEMN